VINVNISGVHDVADLKYINNESAVVNTKYYLKTSFAVAKAENSAQGQDETRQLYVICYKLYVISYTEIIHVVTREVLTVRIPATLCL
jgi:hypothetical protein